VFHPKISGQLAYNGPEWIADPYPMHVASTVDVSVVKKVFQPGQWLLSSSTILMGCENCHATIISWKYVSTEVANLQSSSFQVVWL